MKRLLAVRDAELEKPLPKILGLLAHWGTCDSTALSAWPPLPDQAKRESHLDAITDGEGRPPRRVEGLEKLFEAADAVFLQLSASDALDASCAAAEGWRWGGDERRATGWWREGSRGCGCG